MPGFIRRTIIKDMGWNHIVRQVNKAQRGTHTKVGFLEGHEVAPPKRKGSDHDPIEDMYKMVRIAIVHNWGARITINGKSVEIPERPFFTRAFDNNFDDIRKKMAQLWVKVIHGMPIEMALEIGGAYVIDLIQLEIRRGDFTPLSPKTVAKKKSSVILIDREQMLHSISQEVEV